MADPSSLQRETQPFVAVGSWPRRGELGQVYVRLSRRLAPGAIVLADNINTFKTALRPYVERMQSPSSAFHSVTLPIGEGVEFSVLKSLSVN